MNNLCPDRKRVTRKVSGGEITNYGDNPRKKLLAVTMVAVLSIVAVVSVYAVLIGSFTGGDVTVGGMDSSYIRYSSDNVEAGTWNTTQISSGTGVAWYSRLEIPGGYSGPVTIAWHLENKTGASTWTDVTDAIASTSIVLTGDVQNVFATSDGLWAAGNHNWGSDCAWAGTYRVMVAVNSA